MENQTVMERLQKEAEYALLSESRDLVFQTYGKASMALGLGAISIFEFRKLNDMLITHGVNDPAHCQLK